MASKAVAKHKEIQRRIRQTERTLRRSEKARERRLNKEDRLARAEANKLHKTYQSHRETVESGWIPQHIVNKVLSLFGDR